MFELNFNFILKSDDQFFLYALQTGKANYYIEADHDKIYQICQLRE